MPSTLWPRQNHLSTHFCTIGRLSGMLLEQELDDLDAERHVPALVRLRREAKGHRRHVAVIGGARHERHEQEVRQQIFEGEADRDHELERPRGAGVVEERLRHREVPHAIVHVREFADSVEELVVVADRVDLRLDVAQFVERLHAAPRRAGRRRAGGGRRRRSRDAPDTRRGEMPVRNSFTTLA